MIWQVPFIKFFDMGFIYVILLGRVNLYGIYVGDHRAEEVHQ